MIKIDMITGLTLLFIGLKLTNQIDWVWLWVLSPIWISGLIGILVFSTIFWILVFVKGFKKDYKNYKK